MQAFLFCWRAITAQAMAAGLISAREYLRLRQGRKVSVLQLLDKGAIPAQGTFQRSSFVKKLPRHCLVVSDNQRPAGALVV